MNKCLYLVATNNYFNNVIIRFKPLYNTIYYIEFKKC